MPENKIRVAYLSSEVYPFSKTGGLADVAGSLPIALQRLGDVEVWVFTPLYRKFTDPQAFGIQDTGLRVRIWLDQKEHEVGLWAVEHRGVRVYFVDYEPYFGRDHIYGTPTGDDPDNPLRFALWNLAVLAFLKELGNPPDILHLNDWQTGLIPVILKTQPDTFFAQTRTLITIHNLAYQGLFDASFLSRIGLDDRLFHIEALEFYGKLNFLKGGLVFSDLITTVSPTYAKEIQTPEYGYGLDGILRKRADSLIGILNGLDYEVWNPATDSNLWVQYDTDHVQEGKAANKAHLQEIMGLPQDPDIPLFGIVSRLASQKGIDLLTEALPQWQGRKFQLVVLGSGDQALQDALQEIAKRWPAQIAVQIGFDPVLANRIYGGADFFLMPSRYEPCGLGQLIALRYGTLPIVRATGGLKDTVKDVSEPEGYGWVFEPYEPEALTEAVFRAMDLFPDREEIHQLRKRAMALDFSWDRSAKAYREVYLQLKKG